jgi:hypothetical protein
MLYRRYQRKQVFLELEADELLTTHVAHGLWPAGVSLIPGVVNLLGDEVDPSPVWQGKLEGRLQGSRSDVDRDVIKVDQNVTIPIPLLEKKRIGAADDIRFGAEIRQEIKLLKRRVWSK